MDTELYSMGAYFCGRASRARRRGRRPQRRDRGARDRRLRGGRGRVGRGDLQDAPHRARGPLLQGRRRLTTATVPSRRPPRRRWPGDPRAGRRRDRDRRRDRLHRGRRGGTTRSRSPAPARPSGCSAGSSRTATSSATPDAPVTITYFTDLQCEPCADYHFATIPPLIEDLVRDGDAKLELRHFSTVAERDLDRRLCGDGRRRAGAPMAVRAPLLPQPRPVPRRPRITEDLLRGVAGAVLELDDSDWEAAIDSEEVRSRVESDAGVRSSCCSPRSRP